MPACSEAAFEAAVEQGLLTIGGYRKHQPSDSDESLTLFPDDVIGFIQDRQPRHWEQRDALLTNRTHLTLPSRKVAIVGEGTLHREVVA